MSKGDSIYFRVNSIDDGRYDAVQFDPTIAYTGVDNTRVDENGMPAYTYNASSDYAYGGMPMDVVAPITGTATLSGTLVKDNATTDDVTLLITQGNSTVFSQTLTWDQTGSFPVSANLSTQPGDRIRVRIDTDSRIDLTGIHFDPHMAYDTIMGQPAPVDQNGDPAIVLTPTLTAQIYPQNMASTTAAYVPWTVPTNLPANNLQLWVRQAVTITNPSIPPTYTTNIALEVKQPGQRLAKQRVDVRNGAVSGTNRLDVHIPVTPGETLYFETDATSPDTFDMASLSNMQLVAETISGTVNLPAATFDAHAGTPVTEAFGGGFRRLVLRPVQRHQRSRSHRREPTAPARRRK